jgi:hypothetical protein
MNQLPWTTEDQGTLKTLLDNPEELVFETDRSSLVNAAESVVAGSEP